MEKLRKIAALAGMFGNPLSEHFICSGDYLWYNSGYRVKLANRVLREFTVNGKKVMAFSKKDAIKRLKHS